MAVNTSKRKRVPTKHIRDGIKSKYNKGTECEICGATHELEYHHYHTVSCLLEKYAKENGIPISTDEQVLAMRDGFYELFWHELVEDAVTLCNDHHKALHKVYSQQPPLSTADKQRRWVAIQAAKNSGSYENVDSSLSKFIVSGIDLNQFIVR